jgi:DNA-binding transcriptional regulator YdaS (Cro superfamily)
MDIREYIFYEKVKDKTFSRKKFAQQIGISKGYLDKIMSKKTCIRAWIAYRIEQVTEGKISGWQLIKDYMENKNERK